MACLVVSVVIQTIGKRRISRGAQLGNIIGPGVGVAEPMSVRVWARATPANATASIKTTDTAARRRQTGRVSERLIRKL